MKSFIVLAAFCVLGAIAHNGKAHKGMLPPKIKAYWEECMFENGLTKENWKDIMANKKYSELGCVSACMHEKLDLVDENGNVKIDAYIKASKHILTAMGQKFDDDVKAIIVDCIKSSSTVNDRCQKFMSLTTCVAEKYIQHVTKNHL